MSKDILSLDAKQLELLAQGQVDTENSAKTGAQILSTRNGRLSLAGMPINGDAVNAIILCSPIERLFYEGAFDASSLVPPACAAIGSTMIDLKPNSNSLIPQNDTCEGCPRDQWGSAGEGRKGKACRETRRILFLTADEVTSPESATKAALYGIRPPVTSIAGYSAYIKTIAATLRKPSFAVKTRIALVPDAKSQFKVTFTFLEELKDMATIVALMNRASKELEVVLHNSSDNDFSSLKETPVNDDDVPF